MVVVEVASVRNFGLERGGFGFEVTDLQITNPVLSSPPNEKSPGPHLDMEIPSQQG